MADYPIIFSAPMVQALLAGRKTMTRRLAWREGKPRDAAPLKPLTPFRVKTAWQKVQPGDRLWVREGWKACGECGAANFLADSPARCRECDYPVQSAKGRPSIHMPRWASRLTLIVDAVKVEALQAITPVDAEAEGVFRHVAEHSMNKVFRSERGPTAIKYFRDLWIKLHGPDAWAANPEVVALTFRVIRKNIDQVKS